MSVSLKFTGDSGDLERAHERVDKGVNEIASSYRRLKTEGTEVNRLVARGAKEAETATERWKRQADLLNQAFRAGKINQQELAQSLAVINQELDDAGDAAEAAFGGGITSKLSSLAGGLVSTAAVVGTLQSAWAGVRQEAEGAAAAQLQSVARVGELAQIAQTSEDFAKLAAGAREFVASGASNSLGEAAEALFAIRSAGLDDATELFKQLGSAGVVQNLDNLARSVGLVRQGFGAGQAGSAQQIISQAFAVGDVTPNRIDQILAGLAEVAPTAKAIGLSRDDAAAALAVVGGAFGVDRAKTKVDNLFQSFDKLNIESGSLGERIKKVSERDITDDESLAALRLIRQAQETGELARIQTSLSQAAGGGRVTAALGFAQADEAVAAALTRRRAEGVQDVTLEGIGTVESLRQARSDLLDSIQARLGINAFRRFFTRQLSSPGAQSLFGGTGLDPFSGDDVINSLQVGAIESGQRDVSGMIRELRQIGESLEKVIQQQQAVRTRPPVPTPESAR